VLLCYFQCRCSSSRFLSITHPEIQTQIALQQLFVCTLISTIIIIGIIFFVIVPKHKSSDSGASHAQI
jgi:hypothetical protein